MMEDIATGPARLRSTSNVSECSDEPSPEPFENIEMVQVLTNSPTLNSRIPSLDGQTRAKSHAGLMAGARHLAGHLAGKVKTVVGLVTGSSAAIPDSELTFTDICKKLHKMLIKLHKKYGATVISVELMQAVNDTSEMVNRKEICISVFGQHNCGKSTLLNSLLGEEILPSFGLNETSLKVKVQHNSYIHQGICTANCPKRQQKLCPRLEVVHSEESKRETYYGPDKIYSYLKELNRKVRKRQIERPPKQVILKVYIPMLADKVLPGWTVNLVDNPGFGEASEHVSQLAEASMLSSSAYIYLLQTEHIGGKEAAEFFKELAAKDKTALMDGRLAIGITKYDTNYPTKMHSRRRSHEVSLDQVKNDTIDNIKDATGVNISGDAIIPLCGEWAFCGSKLALCLIHDPENKRKEIIQDAINVLDKHPHFSTPSGEGRSQIDAIRDLDPTDIVTAIETNTGICHLKERVHYVVGNACVKVWATKILSEFRRSQDKAEEAVQSRCEEIMAQYSDMTKTHGEGMDSLENITKMRESVRAAAPKRKRKTAKIWGDFEVAYDMDVKNSNLQQRGKEQVKLLISHFREECKRKILNKTFGPDEFEQDLQHFLDDSALKLQQMFDTVCGFRNVQQVLLQHVVHMATVVTRLQFESGKLCEKSGATDSTTGRDRSLTETRPTNVQPPKLADIKLRVKIPSVSVGWWARILQFFRSHGPRRLRERVRLSASESNESVKQTSETDSLDHSTTLNGDSPIPLSSPIQDDNDDDDDDDGAWLDEDDTVVDINEVTVDERESMTSADKGLITKAIVPSPVDTDGDSKPKAQASAIYRKWTKELDAAIDEIQVFMEEECDKYFEIIKPKAIKVFYKDFYRETRRHLQTFQTTFGDALEDKRKDLKKLFDEAESLKKVYYDLQEKKSKVHKLGDLLFEKYSNEFGQLPK